jgi:hypothetical protein
MKGPPLPISLKQQRDHALCEKFRPHLERLCIAFSAQNREAAHAIMVTLVHQSALVAHQCGMRTDREFSEFARLVFADLLEQRK